MIQHANLLVGAWVDELLVGVTRGLTDKDRATVAELLAKSGLINGVHHGLAGFKKIASARCLYHWNSENHSSY
ncbi:MAG: hypothetical protein ABSG31_09300 [Tepidisphaeraceae bacterium]